MYNVLFFPKCMMVASCQHGLIKHYSNHVSSSIPFNNLLCQHSKMSFKNASVWLDLSFITLSLVITEHQWRREALIGHFPNPQALPVASALATNGLSPDNLPSLHLPYSVSSKPPSSLSLCDVLPVPTLPARSLR